MVTSFEQRLGQTAGKCVLDFAGDADRRSIHPKTELAALRLQ